MMTLSMTLEQRNGLVQTLLAACQDGAERTLQDKVSDAVDVLISLPCRFTYEEERVVEDALEYHQQLLLGRLEDAEMNIRHPKISAEVFAYGTEVVYLQKDLETLSRVMNKIAEG